MKNVVVIGGGLSGLTSAVYLSKNNYKVTLLESSPKLGGRTFSYKEPESGLLIDNGQHILWGCYYKTIELINLIKAENNFYFQNKFEIPFLHNLSKIYKIKSSTNIYPLNLVSSILSINFFTLKEKVLLANAFVNVQLINIDSFKDVNVAHWLTSLHQTDKLIKYFWDVLVTGAFNSSLEDSSAKTLIIILKEMFFKNPNALKIILPKYDLNTSLICKAEEFVKYNKGEIFTSEKVEELIINNNKISSIVTSKRKLSEYDYIVSAVPHYAFQKILPNEDLSNYNYNYNPILNFTVWLKNNPLKEKFYSVMNSPLQWIFNHKDFLAIVVSNPDYSWNSVNAEEVVKTELKKILFLEDESISKIISFKEKRATFIPSINLKRPNVKSSFENLFLAGDWINNNFPATIEGAVINGFKASELIMKADQVKTGLLP